MRSDVACVAESCEDYRLAVFGEQQPAVRRHAVIRIGSGNGEGRKVGILENRAADAGDVAVCVKHDFRKAFALVEAVAAQSNLVVRELESDERGVVVERLRAELAYRHSLVVIELGERRAAAERAEADGENRILYGDSSQLVAVGEAELRHLYSLVKVELLNRRACEHCVRQAGVLGHSYGFELGRAAENLRARVTERNEVDFFKRGAAAERAVADCVNLAEVNTRERRAAAERICADYDCILFKIYRAQLLVAVERIFSDILQRFGKRYALQLLAVVERVLLDFLNALGDGHAGNRLVAFGHLVGVVVVLGKLDVTVGGVQTERERTDVQYALVVGDYDVAAQALVSHERAVFDNERVFDVHRQAGADIGIPARRLVGRNQRDGSATLAECGNVALVVDFQDRFVAGNVP